MKEKQPFPVFVGPCVIESEEFAVDVAKEIKKQLSDLPIKLTFKASFDKANRSSIEGYRGPGIEKGLKILEKVKGETGLPILTDFHMPEQAVPVAEVADVLQVPAFLCRQTDIVTAGASAALRKGRALNIKKGQFLAPWDTKNIIAKVDAVQSQWEIETDQPPLAPGIAREWFCITERGVSFGYNTLIVDMSAFQIIKALGVKAIYDATHSVQKPGNAPGGKATGGKRDHIEVLARGAVAAGASGVFLEVHPNPPLAKSDGPNAFFLHALRPFIEQLLKIYDTVWDMKYLLPETEGFNE